MRHAACKDDLEPFFPNKGRSPSEAIAICQGCSVTDQCRSYAHEKGVAYGVWAGKLHQPNGRSRASQPDEE